MKIIPKIREGSVTTGSAREDLFELRCKLNEIIRAVNKLIKNKELKCGK